jgi:hypothetical protein
LPAAVDLANFDFIKLGPFDPERGGLGSPETNQRFYRIEDSDNKSGEGRKMVDATSLFCKKSLSSLM